MLNTLFELEGNILLAIQGIRCPILDKIMIFITHLADKGIIWIAIAVLLMLFKKTRKVGMMMSVALIFSLIVNNGILKLLVERTRPYDAVEGLTRIVPKQVDFSFPSGHTGSSFAAAIVIYRQMPRKYGIPAMILAILIAFSRMYVGVHYPTDVLVGVIDGIVLGILAEYLFTRKKNKNA